MRSAAVEFFDPLQSINFAASLPEILS